MVLGDFHTFTIIAGSAWEKKNLQPFHISGNSSKYRIKYKDKIFVTFTYKPCKAWNKYLGI